MAKNWLLIACGVLVGSGLLAGCMAEDDDTAVAQRDANGQRTGLVIFTDAATGCQYVRTLRRDGIAQRMGKDGKQICGQNAKSPVQPKLNEAIPFSQDDRQAR